MLWDFRNISSLGGWSPEMITGSTSITLYPGTGMKEIPRFFSGGGFWMAMMFV
jgi:hypothetical protein